MTEYKLEASENKKKRVNKLPCTEIDDNWKSFLTNSVFLCEWRNKIFSLEAPNGEVDIL